MQGRVTEQSTRRGDLRIQVSEILLQNESYCHGLAQHQICLDGHGTDLLLSRSAARGKCTMSFFAKFVFPGVAIKELRIQTYRWRLAIPLQYNLTPIQIY
jgi:hypothetical protein